MNNSNTKFLITTLLSCSLFLLSSCDKTQIESNELKEPSNVLKVDVQTSPREEIHIINKSKSPVVLNRVTINNRVDEEDCDIRLPLEPSYDGLGNEKPSPYSNLENNLNKMGDGISIPTWGRCGDILEITFETNTGNETYKFE